MASIYDKRPWLKNYPEWSQGDFEITPDTAISDFEASATRKPDAPAVYYFDHTITYGEVDRSAERLASAFSDLGTNKGNRIIAILQNVPQFLVVAYAGWKLGAIVVP